MSMKLINSNTENVAFTYLFTLNLIQSFLFKKGESIHITFGLAHSSLPYVPLTKLT